MHVAENGKSVSGEISFWLNEEDGSIHISSHDIPGFTLVKVNNEPDKQNGHPTLYKRLSACLRDMGVPAPAEES